MTLTVVVGREANTRKYRPFTPIQLGSLPLRRRGRRARALARGGKDAFLISLPSSLPPSLPSRIYTLYIHILMEESQARGMRAGERQSCAYISLVVRPWSSPSSVVVAAVVVLAGFDPRTLNPSRRHHRV